jgi:TetR/AcrR family transcriptional regulator, transcriptional repressor of bet genes
VNQASGERVTVREHQSGGSRIRQRQRQRLIDACISALHIYGPSNTTVEKVVALADLSPGIVRFYFDSKAAMLVASLEYLAAEFDERVLGPVARLKDTPVPALRLLVNLYLDADIASPRKVSVWYAFWGEASARQEYQDICGKKDEAFAVLVRELVERLIAMSGASHLDADAVALGLIGVLEILWQGIAFQSEANIDRPAAVARSLRYLQSVFPGEFDEPVHRAPASSAAAVAEADRLPPQAYLDPILLAAERERLLRPAWQVLGHEAELRTAGDYLSGEIAGERVLVVRGDRGRLHAFRNACRRRPHALVSARRGHLKSAIHCAAHTLTYAFDGRLVDGSTPGDLAPLPLRRAGQLVLVRAAGAAAAEPGTDDALWDAFAALEPRAVTEQDVAADWKLVVEQWLETPLPQRHFIAPNQLLEVAGDRASILQVTPTAPGHSRVRRFEFSSGRARAGRERRVSGRERPDAWLREQIALAESTQAGLQGAAETAVEAGPVDPALARFRAQITAVMHALSEEPGAR